MSASTRIVAALAALALVVACRSERPTRTAERGAASSEQAPSGISPEESGSPLRQESVTLYFPSASTDGLVAEHREILRTTTAGDRAKQILSDLLAGPSDDTALRPLPSGTRLKQVYVLEDGTAYADFSEELRAGIEGGSDSEILAVYSIVNSVAMNVPEIRRVGILVEGRPCETLNGHLDLRTPLAPDRKLVYDARPDA